MSLTIFAIRHAATQWNLQKRLQGRCDIPLSSAGLNSLQGKSIPDAYMTDYWYCSPLLRTQQTADALGLRGYRVTPELIEMDWGQWEGHTLTELRTQLGKAMDQEEAKGLDLNPSGGESPRQVQQRLLCWLKSLPEAGDVPPMGNDSSCLKDNSSSITNRIGIVAHKGVLRAMLSQALNWDMTDDCPIKIDWHKGIVFTWHKEKGLSLAETNVALE